MFTDGQLSKGERAEVMRKRIEEFTDVVYNSYELSQGAQPLQDMIHQYLLVHMKDGKSFLKTWLTHVPYDSPKTTTGFTATWPEATGEKARLLDKVYKRYAGPGHPKRTQGTSPEAIATALTGAEERTRSNLESVLHSLHYMNLRGIPPVTLSTVVDQILNREMHFIPSNEVEADPLADPTYHDRIERRKVAYQGSQLCYYVLSDKRKDHYQHMPKILQDFLEALRAHILASRDYTLRLAAIVQYYNKVNAARPAEERDSITL